MRRRDLLPGLLATTTAGALRAAEPNKVYRLAACTQFGMDRFSIPGAGFSPFFARLRQVGFTEGKNLTVDRYAAEGQPERFAEIARNIIKEKPDVIVVGWDHQLISRIAKETSTIPIVALIPSMDAGLVRNMSRPEGNITGFAMDAGIEMQGKHLDLLRQAVPSASRVAYLSNRFDWEGPWGQAVLEAGRNSGISVIGVPIEHSAGAEEYRRAFETMVQQSADALMFNGLAPNSYHGRHIAELALKYRLPSICWSLNVVKKGQGFLAYAPDYHDLPDRYADQVDRILKGAMVSDIPIYQPTKFMLAINLKTAKALGLEIPTSLIGSADEVIE